jgi:hypothetical protein
MELVSNEAAHVDAQSEEWFASYAEPPSRSSNGHRHVRHRRSRDPRRKRNQLNMMAMIASVLFVGAMTACFYAVLTR